MRGNRWRTIRGLATAAILGAGVSLVALPGPASAGTPAIDRPRCTGYVGLTFDDGPTPGNTPALLKALKAAGLRATMFNVGQNVQANPQLAKDQVAAGMWIGNHSWDHPYMTRLGAEEQAAQISRTQDAVKAATGITPQLFRPPYLDTDDALRAVERQYGLTEINADVDSQDWNNATAAQIVASARKLQAGDVILMHDWPAATVEAVPRIAADLRRRGLCAGMISPDTGRAVAPRDVLAQAHTAGRVQDLGTSVRYTWPGVSFEGRFRGTGVGIVLNDAANDYDVQVDGAAPATLRTPGRTTYWVSGLRDGTHTVRVAKRTESPWQPGEFGGFVAAPGGRVLDGPAPRARQIEFIGDSWTAGYGNMSTVRDCGATGGVNPNSNADQTFGALTARGLNADYQLTAWSGMGMVRNYNGGNPGTTFRTFYDRTLQAADLEVWQPPRGWRPQLVVVGLGINDFSTALNPGEPWADLDALAADYRAAYLGFLDTLRARYGKSTYIVLTYPTMSNTTALADSVQQIVRQRNAQGDGRVKALHYDNAALGLDLLGCDWHPSLHDHKALAGALGSFIATLPLRW
ncbi:Endo-1,4-beta-xylanase A precursor [[Actinomadura] parvosata subsp. kistnae]|nr:polysaccharide deacetylase family protein [Nonomuraea sp. ATCC 55076]SPL99420.1 Endo-1,4-beta-xylanase A precursor [Actinomadura parvosata subsp. kistnae]